MDKDHPKNRAGENGSFFTANYLYFATFFVLIAFLHGYHMFIIESINPFAKWFYFVTSLGQCFLEMAVLLLMSWWLQYYGMRAIKLLFIIATFLLFLSQGIDFLLVRLMDMTVWYALEFVSQESFQNFMELLAASNISLMTWIGGALIASVLVAIGVVFYRITEKLSEGRRLIFYPKLAVSICCSLAFLLFLWESVLSPFAKSSATDLYVKALPWKITFSPEQEEVLVVNGFIKDPWKDKDCFAELDSSPFSLQRKPDIYLFVAESLRDDYITESIAPHLARFKADNIHCQQSHSNANATQISWFSLFYSLYPFYWTNYHCQQWKSGSTALQLLKKMGYEIRLYASSKLNYYHMDQMIFGENHYLADQFHNYGDTSQMQVHQSDAKAVDTLCHDMQTEEKSGGRVFIVFLDSTHFDYSFPTEEAPPFAPIDDKINFLHTAFSTESLDKIINRYKNSVHYVDSLFGRFLHTLDASPAGKESIVVFTADHGEEFFEHGHIFHSSELTLPQLHIALYYKLGTSTLEAKKEQITTQMDIFPTIFHYLIGEQCFEGTFQGESIFQEKSRPFAVGVRNNFGRAPYEFYIHNGTHKLVAQFCNKADVFHCKSLRIVATKNSREENVQYSLSSIRNHFGQALDQIFVP